MGLNTYQEFKYITIVQITHPPGVRRKTFDYEITNNKSGSVIGVVEYANGWRQHVLAPEHDTIWSVGCMEDVISFINELKRT